MLNKRYQILFKDFTMTWFRRMMNHILLAFLHLKLTLHGTRKQPEILSTFAGSY
jgi:hypothetical protein